MGRVWCGLVAAVRKENALAPFLNLQDMAEVFSFY